MSCEKSCHSKKIISNQVSIQWSAFETPVFPYNSDQLTAISGYVLNNNSSKGSVTVNFLRGGIGGSLLPFSLIVQKGEYKSFVILGVDTIKIDSGNKLTSGELNITINFSPF